MKKNAINIEKSENDSPNKEFIEDFVESYYELIGRRETTIGRSKTDISM